MAQAMKWHGMVPEVIPYNVVTSACEKGEQPKQAVEMFHAMQWHGSVRGIVTYSDLISTCEKGNQSKQAWVVPCNAVARWGGPQNQLYNARMNACEKGE